MTLHDDLGLGRAQPLAAHRHRHHPQLAAVAGHIEAEIELARGRHLDRPRAVLR